MLAAGSGSYRTLKRLVEQRTAARTAAAAPAPTLTQAAPGIRPIDDYQRFFDDHTQPTGDRPCR